MSTEDFRRIVESLRVAVAVADPEGAATFANAAFAQLVGRAPGDIAGAPLASFFAEDDRKRVRQNVARVGEGKAASAIVEANIAVPKGTRWVQVTLQPVPGREKAAGVVAIVHDIENQRDTEQALLVITARLLALADASPMAALIENAQGDVEMVNAAFCRLMGIDAAPQSLMGLPVDEVMARASRTVALERQPVIAEGEPAGGVWVPRKESAGAEALAKGPAEIALIERIGAELSVALEGLSAISIRAQQMEFDPALVAHFLRIRQSTETALAAIGDLVDFSRFSGGVVLHKAPFELRTAIADLVERIVERAEESRCRLRIKVEQDVADSLEGDVERLQLVLRNLLHNAFALLPGAEVTLQITPEYVTESGIQLSFGVLASSEGEPSSRRRPGSNDRAPASGGATRPVLSAEAGMGVAVARFMVAAMGGDLAIASHPAAGGVIYAFTIEFPVRAAPPPPPRPTYVSLVGMPVLVVASDPEQRLALANLLRGWRMVPLEADNAPMALALMERLHGERNPVPLVILSNRLPLQDGFLLAFRIKHHRKLSQAIVMMLATEGRPGDAIACRENGISAYMRYPIHDRQLNEAMLAVTGASATADATDTATLVTRHSLRESRKGATLLLVDASRDTQILAAHILGRHDCSVVLAQSPGEAFNALDQDFYDLILVDTAFPALAGDDAPSLLRAHIAREAESARIVAMSSQASAAWRDAKLAAGYSAAIGKPFRKDELLGLLSLLDRRSVEAD